MYLIEIGKLRAEVNNNGFKEISGLIQKIEIR